MIKQIFQSLLAMLAGGVLAITYVPKLPFDLINFLQNGAGAGLVFFLFIVSLMVN